MQDELLKLNFEKTHQIMLVDENPVFRSLTGTRRSEAPSVYVWTVETSGADEMQVLYVGKAGKGIHRRCSQHQDGFVNSDTGRKNADALRQLLQDKSVRVWVFSRSAKVIELFGEKVSLYAAEEDALCKKLKPTLNRAAFPSVTTNGRSQKDILALINKRFKDQENQGALDDLLAELESYDLAERNNFRKLLLFVEDELLSPDHCSAVVGRYSGQPAGCNGVTVLNYAIFSEKSRRMKRNSWVARITVGSEIRIVMPTRWLKKSKLGDVDIGSTASFSPRSTSAFLQDPFSYIKIPSA